MKILQYNTRVPDIMTLNYIVHKSSFKTDNVYVRYFVVTELHVYQILNKNDKYFIKFFRFFLLFTKKVKRVRQLE